MDPNVCICTIDTSNISSPSRIYYYPTILSYEYMKYPNITTIKPSKPGPKPNKCKWCQEVQCSHCQCPGYSRCDHAKGEPCVRHRYKRRLVCNTCEKAKLRDESNRKQGLKVTGKEKATMEKSKSLNHCIPSRPSSILVNQAVHNRKASSFDALYALASNELKRINPPIISPIEKDPSHSPSEDVGLSVDSTSSGTHQSNNDMNYISKQSVIQHNHHEKFILPLPSQPISPPIPIPTSYPYPMVPAVQPGSLNGCNPVYLPPVGPVTTINYNPL